MSAIRRCRRSTVTTARRPRLSRRSWAGHDNFPRYLTQPAIAARRRSRRGQDRGCQGVGGDDRWRADPSSVTGHRCKPGAVRMELHGAAVAPAASHGHGNRCRRRRTRGRTLSERFLVRRPLLRAIDHGGDIPPVLLIDEVDRADDEFEAFLLEALSTSRSRFPSWGPSPPTCRRS